jgi:LytS/YehU family sensor histidine kinase
MILILFIENSFKHGVKNNINKINIAISLLVEDKTLYFRIENPVQEDEVSTESAGIGLKNGRRRLDLLYGDRYSLDISIKERIFIVLLKIPVC